MPASDTPSVAVQIRAGAALLDGDLTLPPRPLGLVVFAHGSGSSRFSRRNRAVAGALGQLLQLLDKIHWICLAFAVELAAGSGILLSLIEGGRQFPWGNRN